MTAISLVRSLAVFFVLSLHVSCSWASPLEPGMKAVESIRGRKFLREVRNVTIKRSELPRHLTEQMRRSTPYSLEEWGRILRALQLVDVETSEVLPKLLDLYQSQVLAFYDPSTHTYYSLDELPELPEGAANLADPKMLEEMVMVHELVHALQDQHFALSKNEKTLMKDTDANLAYHAVLEGEAVLVMAAHVLQRAGVDYREAFKDDAMIGLLANASQAGSMIDPTTPPYFARMLEFPYLKGLEFVLAAYRRGGWEAVDRLHSHPPRTTREILNPEEYFARKGAAPVFDGKKPADAVTAEKLGEFHWRFLVGDAAAGLVNDRAIVYRDDRVTVRTEWGTPQQAAAFATAYRTFLARRPVQLGAIEAKGSTVEATYTTK